MTDWNNSTIRQIVIATQVVTTLAGTPGITGSANGTGPDASFLEPAGITTDGTNLYVAEQANNDIRMIVIATQEVTTFAGSGVAGSNNAIGTAATFNLPHDITTDGINLYVADRGNQMIRQIVIDTQAVTTLAGSGAVGSANGIGTAATFNGPAGITSDGTSLYVAEYLNQTIRKIEIATQAVTTLAGLALTPGSTNGPVADARFLTPESVTTDGTNLYVADYGNSTIRMIQ